MSEDDDININEDAETDFIVHPVTQEKNLFAYGLYFRLMSYEHHYSNIILKYHRMCITWLLSSLIGISYLLCKNWDAPFDKFTAIASPIPLLAPVTTAFFPLIPRFIIMYTFQVY